MLGGVHLLSRLLPITFELPEDKRVDFFWSGDNPLAQTLCSTILNLFFKEDFTVGRSKDSTRLLKLDFCVWHSGVAYTNTVHDKESQYYVNRLAVVKLLLAMFSSLLYTTNESLKSYVDPVMWLFCSAWNERAKETLFSLLNFAFDYENASFVSWS